ncbi:unnamed protein product [Brassicogethes aeneus]|uniref:DNA mismatch repair protein S5 domain-containing protein n=1 Tax=Brassicogethes aeneus TaxID=1431903 RepID=A0A9P0FLC9_BRAAE|nr:unnamed protein product [Brassicogethes aeneus]
MEPPKEIKKLREEVVNRIAAGEVVQRPANALKELIENSIDAKANNIQITVKNGGLKLLQIQDNGTGIRKEDFPILCERFTTSKLKEFEDLSSISTYGFRGEALASISHIAHLTITSKTKKDVCAHQARFVDGVMQGATKAVAGNQGTIITVEDLFYNMNVRRNALRSVADEYARISDVVSKYAVHNAGIGFALKKSGGNNDIRTPPKASHIDNIRVIYGNTIARELTEFSWEDPTFKFKSHGFITNVNYSTKKFVFLLFINHRLVECTNLKKCIDQVYTTYLPKNMHPFVYLSLELDPITVDVNVHPTKHEVHFLNEEQIIESVCGGLEKKLLGSNNSRVFYTQAKLPTAPTETFDLKDEKSKKNDGFVHPKDFVRTDTNMQKIEKFFGPAGKKVDYTAKRKEEAETANKDVSLTEEDFNRHHEGFIERNENFENLLLERTVVEERKIEDKIRQPIGDVLKEDGCVKISEVFEETNLEEEIPNEDGSMEKRLEEKIKCLGATKHKSNDNLNFIARLERVETKLTSILELRQEIEDDCHKMLRETFAQLVYVGAVDTKLALIQFNTKLLLCNTRTILEELFYQYILYHFQNFGRFAFQSPIAIADLAMLCLDLPETGWTPEDGSKEELADKVRDVLVEKADMLDDYFSLGISEQGHLKSLPILLDDYIPDEAGLPTYIMRLATEVDWENEKNCFKSFARETALYYSEISESDNPNGKDWKWVVEYIVYPAVKDYFIPPKSFTENAAVLEIANLPNLYKVFERC